MMFYADREEEARVRHRVKDSACRDCLFFQPLDGVHEMGPYCRRRAPQENRDGIPGWPLVEPDDWCGEFLWQDVPE